MARVGQASAHRVPSSPHPADEHNRALLCDVQVFIEEDDSIRTGINTALRRTLHRVMMTKHPVSCKYPLTGQHPCREPDRSASEMSGKHFHLGKFLSLFSQLSQNARIRLWLGDRCPIIRHVHLCNDLTGMTAVALSYIDYKTSLPSLSSQHETFQKAVGVLRTL